MLISSWVRSRVPSCFWFRSTWGLSQDSPHLVSILVFGEIFLCFGLPCFDHNKLIHGSFPTRTKLLVGLEICGNKRVYVNVLFVLRFHVTLYMRFYLRLTWVSYLCTCSYQIMQQIRDFFQVYQIIESVFLLAVSLLLMCFSFEFRGPYVPFIS